MSIQFIIIIPLQLGKLTKNINELVIKLGVKDGLAGLLSKITSGIGIGLESLNNLLKGDINVDNVTNGLMMIGGVASLLMPGRMLGLAFKAAKLLALTPAGRALLFVAGGAKLISDLLADPKKGDARFLTGPEGDIDYAGQQEKIAAGDTEGPGSGPMSTFDMVSNSLLAAYGLKKGFDFVKYMKNLKKGGVKGSPQLDLFKDAKPKGKPNFFSRMMNAVKSGGRLGRFGLLTAGSAAVFLPLAAVGLVEKYFGDDFRAENEKQAVKTKLKNLDILPSSSASPGTLGMVEDLSFTDAAGNKYGGIITGAHGDKFQDQYKRRGLFNSIKDRTSNKLQEYFLNIGGMVINTYLIVGFVLNQQWIFIT